MAPVSIRNRLLAANKRLLIRIIFCVDSHGVFCNTFLLCLFCKRFKFHRFSNLTVVYRQNTLILESRRYEFIETLKTIPDKSTHRINEPLGYDFFCFNS
jgi:hypothetical protein